MAALLDVLARFRRTLSSPPLSKPPTAERLEPLPLLDAVDRCQSHPEHSPHAGSRILYSRCSAAIWTDLDAWALDSIAGNAEGLAGFLHQYAPLWRQVGRVCFHLAENKQDPEFPFAFMATYIPRLGKNARAQHLPLSQALREYAGANNREALLRLLEPVHEASTRCEWVRELLESGDIYHPLAWTPEEAYLFLKDVPALEESGLVVRLPDWWKKRPRPRVQVAIGSNAGETLSAQALLDFRVQLTLDGADLTPEEIAALTAAGEGLALLRGQWVEVDGEKLRQALEQWQRVEAEAGDDGLSFMEGMRLLSGARRDLSGNDPTLDETGWAFVEAGDRLREMLAGLREPARLAAVQAGDRLQATLRPYQQTGLNWLWFLSELGLGACLADDMGLGKTIQVISLLLAQQGRAGKTVPSLLVLPASLLSNWKSELERFAPSLSVVCLHPSEMERTELERIAADPESSSGLRRRGADHLRHASAPGVDQEADLEPDRAGRGPGHQKPRHAAGQGGQDPFRKGADRPDRHPGGKPSVRSLVAVRLHLPRPARLSRPVQAIRHLAGKPRATIVCTVTHAGAALYPAPPQDRPERHQRSPGQGRDGCLVRTQQGPGPAVRPGGEGSGRGAEGAAGGDETAGSDSFLTDAVQADLQPSRPGSG